MILNTRQQQDNNSTIRFCTLLKKDANIFELLLKELPVISSHEVRSGVRPARPTPPRSASHLQIRPLPRDG